MTRRSIRRIVAVAGVLAAAVVFTVRVSPPTPPVAPVKVRWSPSVGAVEQAAKESGLRLRRGEPHSDRTWNYDLLDTSPGNIRSLISDPAVEDTDGIDRQAFRIAAPPLTIAELLTTEVPVLERLAGRGFRQWLSSANAWPGAVAAVWLIAFSRPSVRAAVLRGIPRLSPVGLGVFRIALGVMLLISVPGAAELPQVPLPRELHRAADGFADWSWVHWLALHPDASNLVLTLALGALVLFAAGVVPRVIYLIALTAITARVFVLLQFRSAHDWGLPLVALWGLVLVPWDAGLTLVPFRRQRAEEKDGHGYALWFPGAVLGLGLLAAAYAKLDTSGHEWVSGGAVKYHFIEDFVQAPTTWGLWIAARPAWAVAASVFAIAFESLFILHIAYSQPRVRALFGMAALSFFAGLYLLQGVFWPLWWVLLLAFVPWEPLAAAASRAMPVPRARAPATRRAQAALVAGVVCVQIFASARRVEVEPFVSDYGMYSWTWASQEAFDQRIARKYHAYRYTVESSGGTIDVTDRLRALPNAIDTLTEVVDRQRNGTGLLPAHRNELRVVSVMYSTASDAPAGRLTVLLDEQAFDWTRARFFPRADGERIGVLDLSTDTFIPAASSHTER